MDRNTTKNKDEKFDYFKWFKTNHLNTLKQNYSLLRELFMNKTYSMKYNSKDATKLLKYVDEIIYLNECLPNTKGGKESVEDLKNYRKEFVNDYNKEGNRSYFIARDINLVVFSIYNYMDALCEDS